MPYVRSALAIAAVLLLAVGPARAQQADQQAGQQPSAPPPGVVATTNNPNLTVSTVRLENGARVGKIIGAGVYLPAKPNEQVGSVDDLILNDSDKATVAIVAVGGVFGLGTKLIALPYNQLQRQPNHPDRMMLPGVTRDELNAMPTFEY